MTVLYIHSSFLMRAKLPRGRTWIVYIFGVGISKKEVVLTSMGCSEYAAIPKNSLIGPIFTARKAMHDEWVSVTFAIAWVVRVSIFYEVEGLVNKSKLGG